MAAETQSPADLGEAALRAIDKVLADKPDKVGHDFSEAVRCLAHFREAVIPRTRREGTAQARERLGRLNAVISVLYGGQFPIGGVPWDHVEKARDSLAALLQELGSPVEG